MTDKAFSRRRFLEVGSLATGAMALGTGAGAAARAAENSGKSGAGEVFSKARGDWAPLRLVQPDAMAWQDSPNWELKYLFQNAETGAHLIMLRVPPGWEGGLNHYHEWHEWAYVLSGDLTNDEFVSPDQFRGASMQFREGWFLSRPARSLHGIEPGGLRSQIGCTLIIQEEGPSNETFGVNPKHESYDERYKKVDRWSSPRLLDTIGAMRWDDMADMPGVKVKYLVDNDNFKARLHWIPKGFTASDVPALSRPRYSSTGRQFLFVLFGDLTLQAFAEPGATPERLTANLEQMFDIGPDCITALDPDAPTSQGCVWLDISYGDSRGVVSDAAIAPPSFL